jgi:hypothetical protein
MELVGRDHGVMVSCMVQAKRDHGVVKTDRVGPGLMYGLGKNTPWCCRQIEWSLVHT